MGVAPHREDYRICDEVPLGIKPATFVGYSTEASVCHEVSDQPPLDYKESLFN